MKAPVQDSTHLLDAFQTYWRDSSIHGDDARHIRRKSTQLLVKRYSARSPAISRALTLLTVLLVILVALQIFTSDSKPALLYAPSAFSLLSLGSWLKPPQKSPFDSLICPSCNDTVKEVTGSFAVAEDFSKVPLATRDEVRSSRSSVASKKRYLLHHIVLQSVLERTWMNFESTTAMFSRYFTAPDNLLTLSLEGLELDKPTTYMYTRTGPGGKLHDIRNRVHHLSRHGETLQHFQELVETEGYFDGQPKASRQIIWIVIEDNAQIDPNVAAYLESTGQPYLYFAHGPTRWLGVAQWNAAERAVQVLRDTFFGDGPVMNVDDDARIEPELLRRVWKVKRAISWPVGNLAAPGGWEGAIFKHGVQHEWRLGGLAERIFPIDMNGFAINSSLIGPGRPVAGPWYVAAGDTGAETFFLEKIYSKRSELEGICDDTVEEGCWWAWWNWKEDEKLNAQVLHG
ncbi:glycosyltransferase family 43 protein [Cystobasidium minutum MCA 4210]|uniref:glycosyltransferase family 43 protein n=1 Tax=Cystobasidium minutum MCA 4210 TaxID=1397322 RepID=UPI0034CDEEF5|eukprot:jgi/Rhomi1/168067/fgenesh1_kg.2_\